MLVTRAVSSAHERDVTQTAYVSGRQRAVVAVSLDDHVDDADVAAARRHVKWRLARLQRNTQQQAHVLRFAIMIVCMIIVSPDRAQTSYLFPGFDVGAGDEQHLNDVGEPVLDGRVEGRVRALWGQPVPNLSIFYR